MKCRYCQARLPRHARFCPCCGKAFVELEQEIPKKRKRRPHSFSRRKRILLFSGLALVLAVGVGILFAVCYYFISYEGVLIYDDGSVYTGIIMKQNPHGTGTMDYTGVVSSDLVSYEGEWLSGEKYGKGTQICF